jgi:hypothetical protein
MIEFILVYQWGKTNILYDFLLYWNDANVLSERLHILFC